MNDLYGRSASIVESQQKLELFISCRGLANMDTFSKSDPFVIMQVKRNNQWHDFGRTEIIQDNLNPNFAKSFIIEYFFECQQPLKFIVNDDDGNGTFDHIGSVETTLATIAGSRDQLLVLDLKNQGKKTGVIVIRADQVRLINDKILIMLSADKLPDTRFLFWHTTSPFLRLYRLRKDTNQYLLIYESETIKNSRSPVWKRIDIASQKLCNGDYFMPIKCEIWDYRSSGDHEKICETEISIDELKGKGKVTKQLVDKSKKSAGVLIFNEFKLIEKPSFVDYLQSGVQINLIAAIDFTASNMAPTNPNSLHFIDPQGKRQNEYQQALFSVGEILMNYDHDKKVPLFGFGCKPRLPTLQTNQTLHCFPLNGNPNDPEVFQMEGIMTTYNYALRNVQFDGPTYFNPIIQEAMKIAQMCKDMASDTYFVLLILTDGEIHDMQQTINSIVASSHLPLSIIIVGIGQADFTNMNILDDDDGNLHDQQGKRTQRDLVQFVPFNQYRNNPELLAKNVLQELPDQLVDYMVLIGKKPGPKRDINLGQFDIGKYQQQFQQSFNDLPQQQQQPFNSQLQQFNVQQPSTYNQQGPQQQQYSQFQQQQQYLPQQNQYQQISQQPQQNQSQFQNLKFAQGLANANFLGNHIAQVNQMTDAQMQQQQFQQQQQYGQYPQQIPQYQQNGYPLQGQYPQQQFNQTFQQPYQPQK